jgi:hypothetical protein
MSPLNINPEEEVTVPRKKKNKSLKVMLGIAALVAVPVVGTTLAGSITVNTGGTVQFGQGVTQAAACDDEITVTPTATFANAAGATSTAFSLSTISVAGIASTCDNKNFIIKVYGDTGVAKTVSTTASSDAIQVTFTSSGVTAKKLGVTADYTVADTSATEFVVTLVTAVPASEVYKITVETS